MSLDKKLREILRSGALGNYVKGPDGDFVPLDWSGTPSSYFADDIAQIKQAFKDEGWVELGKDTQGKPIHVQTGKQWLSRLEKECAKLGDKPIKPV